MATLRSLGKALYFCVPQNDKVLSYWDTVEDRLFKIRNSLNIQGIFRQLPLFAPPIDPATLVDIETNVKTWLGQKKIKKFIGRSEYKP